MLSVVMLNAVMLNAVMLNPVMLNAVMLSVVVPLGALEGTPWYDNQSCRPFHKSSGTTGNTKGGSITVPLTSCLTALETAV